MHLSKKVFLCMYNELWGSSINIEKPLCFLWTYITSRTFTCGEDTMLCFRTSCYLVCLYHYCYYYYYYLLPASCDIPILLLVVATANGLFLVTCNLVYRATLVTYLLLLSYFKCLSESRRPRSAVHVVVQVPGGNALVLVIIVDYSDSSRL